MNKRPRTDRPDAANPEWTAAEVARSARFGALPAPLRRKLRGRGPQKTPTKIVTTIRLSPEVIGAFRATGRGWQTRMDELLLAAVKRGRVRAP